MNGGTCTPEGAQRGPLRSSGGWPDSVTAFQKNEAHVCPLSPWRHGIIAPWGASGRDGVMYLQAVGHRRLSAKPQKLVESPEQILPPSEGPSSADPWISDFWPPALRDRKFLFFF